MTFIYGLADLRTDEIRYVGKSDNPETRLKQHLELRKLSARSKKNSWLKSLLSRNLRPTLIILEEVSEDSWENAERRWIKTLNDQGARLTNCTDGGEGQSKGFKHTAEARRKMGIKSIGNQWAKGPHRTARSAEHSRHISESAKRRHAVMSETRKREIYAKVGATRRRRAEKERADKVSA